ncbi:MAG: asparagine synthase (glutamine-hydrolyzing) [Phycisphaerales bacterium]|nr:asparagine synthase (glutamine-hydrolyzing) [Phycisphaerales bacterium]
MCGICGLVDFSGTPPTEDTLRAMVATLRHRGPDDEGFHVSGPVGLGQTRLSIVDLSAAGHQPMFSDDGRVVLVFNGEIYNFEVLRDRLKSEGAVFHSRCDTEVVLQAYIHWGEAAFAQLDGMFAIALWDGPRQELHLARDRFGIKPLYVARLASGIVFGSEMKALLASQRIDRSLNWHALHEYLYYGNPLGENTHFAGIKRLLAGHRLKLTARGAETKAYWSIADVPPNNDSIDVATEQIRNRLRQAVRDHLIGDVPIGVFLSGGIDSSAMTALASQEYAGRIKTYSVGFDFDKGVNELDKARSVAEQFGTEHEELHLKGGEMGDVIERLVRCHDEPFADAANIPLYLLCEQLGGSIKVILQGDGGDEIFAGYRRYNVLSHERFWRAWAAVSQLLPAQARGGVRYDRMMRFLRAMGQRDPALRYAWLMTMEPCFAPPTNLLTPDARQQLLAHDPFARYREVHAGVAQHDAVQRALYTDCQVLLPDTFLEKVDRSTMAHSVEIRVPMLDNNLTSYVMGLRSDVKVRNREKKWILRKALRGIVPDSILDGAKIGFGVPYAYWLRTSLAGFLRSVVLDSAFTEWGIVDKPKLERAIDDHVRGDRDHGFMLYKLLNLGLWYHTYLCTDSRVAV